MVQASLSGRPAQAELFLCDIFDALPKDDMASMEHPIFSLSTGPDRRVLRYDHRGITPSIEGLATIHDKDILIYCISQLMAALNAGRAVSRTVQLTAHDLLLAINRETSGDGYRPLREALERLAGTRIVTTIETGGVETTTGFGLVESWQIVRRKRAGRMVSAQVTLSEWLYRAVLAKSVLTLSREYFRLRKPLERRVYELARKHCGRQAEWTISLPVLLTKSGSTSPLRVFRKMIRDIAAAGNPPDYALKLEPGDLVRVKNYTRPPRATAGQGGLPSPTPEVLETARAAAPGWWDVYALEADWRASGDDRAA